MTKKHDGEKLFEATKPAADGSFSNLVSKAPTAEDIKAAIERLKAELKSDKPIIWVPPVVVPSWVADLLDEEEEDG